MPFDLRDFRDSDFAWLLDVESGGDVFRLSTAPGSAPTGDFGASVAYFPGLDFTEEVPDTVDPFGGSPDARSVDLTLYLDHVEHIATVPDLVERGFDLASARGRLWLWSRNTDSVELVLDGVFAGVEYDLPGEPVTCSLEEITEDDAGLFPPADAVVNSTTWPNAAEKAKSERYPWVLGSPGGVGLYAGPGLMVDETGGAEVLLIAGHPVEATTVEVFNDDDESSGTLSVITQKDGAGRACAVVSLSVPGSLTVDPSAVYFIRWGVTGGGLLKQDGSLMTGAGDVLRWLARYSKMRVDWGRLAAAVPYLNSFQIATVIHAAPDSRFTPWEWAADHLWPILPVALRTGPGGVFPVVWGHSDAGQGSVAHIDVDGGRASLASAVSYSDREDVANELSLYYRSEVRLGKYTSRSTLTGKRGPADDDSRQNLYCAASLTRYRDASGEPEVRAMEESSDVIWSDATAGAVLAWWAQRYALQARLVGYQADIEVAGHVEPGDRVTVTHSDLEWAAKPFWVESSAVTLDGQVMLDLREIVDLAG